jgi:myosin-crossreactive antigen
MPYIDDIKSIQKSTYINDIKIHTLMTSKSIQQQFPTTLNEPITLTKKQNEILTMVCDLYEMKVGEYIKEALIESLKEEITDGDFCGLLAS